MAKKQAKKRHIANSDTDSENSYPASEPTNSSSSTTTKTPYVPRFLIIHSEKEGETISSLSAFVVHKTIMSIAGAPKSIKNLHVTSVQSLTPSLNFYATILQDLGPELQCLLRVKEDFSKVLIFQDAKNNVYNSTNSK